MKRWRLGRGENVDLTFTSAFLLSKVLAAAGTDKKNNKKKLKGGENAANVILHRKAFYSFTDLLEAWLTFLFCRNCCCWCQMSHYWEPQRQTLRAHSKLGSIFKLLFIKQNKKDANHRWMYDSMQFLLSLWGIFWIHVLNFECTLKLEKIVYQNNIYYYY